MSEPITARAFHAAEGVEDWREHVVGMSLIGVYERVGWKLGAWQDVAWYGCP